MKSGYKGYNIAELNNQGTYTIKVKIYIDKEKRF